MLSRVVVFPSNSCRLFLLILLIWSTRRLSYSLHPFALYIPSTLNLECSISYYLLLIYIWSFDSPCLTMIPFLFDYFPVPFSFPLHFPGVFQKPGIGWWLSDERHLIKLLFYLSNTFLFLFSSWITSDGL